MDDDHNGVTMGTTNSSCGYCCCLDMLLQR